MKVLSIDPGLTTGIAGFDGSDNLVYSRSLLPEEFEEFQEWVQSNPPNEVVIERLPLRLKPNLARVAYFFDNLFPSATKIGPGQWKPLARMRFFKYPREEFPKASVHEQDAFKLGIYYLKFHRKVANGSQSEAV